MSIKRYQVKVCLPYLSMDHKDPLMMGPVALFSASQADKLLDPDTAGDLLKYLNAHDLNPAEVSCLSIRPDIPEDKTDQLLVDSLYFYYFALCCQEIYTTLSPPQMRPFTKLISGEEKYVRAMSNRELSNIDETHESKKIIIDTPEIATAAALGKALEITLDPEAENGEDINRLIRSIRYFVDGLMRKFENLVDTGLQLSRESFFPERAIFLMTAFETLFNMNGNSSASTLKQKLRPLFNLKFSRTVEILWKWVDGFYSLHKSVLHGQSNVDLKFTSNENFEISYIDLGTKTFIYAIFNKMHEYQLIEALSESPYSPREFLGIPSCEALIFLWTEEHLLRKLSILLMQLSEGSASDEYIEDTISLAHYYNFLNEKYIKQKNTGLLKYIPSQKSGITDYKNAIKMLLGETIEREGKKVKIGELLPEDLFAYIQNRI